LPHCDSRPEPLNRSRSDLGLTFPAFRGSELTSAAPGHLLGDSWIPNDTFWYRFPKKQKVSTSALYLCFTIPLPGFGLASDPAGQGCPAHPQARCLRYTGIRLYLGFTFSLPLYVLLPVKSVGNLALGRGRFSKNGHRDTQAQPRHCPPTLPAPRGNGRRQITTHDLWRQRASGRGLPNCGRAGGNRERSVEEKASPALPSFCAHGCGRKWGF